MATLISQFLYDNSYADAVVANANDQSAAGSGNTFDTTVKRSGTHSLKVNGSGYATRTSTINGVSGITGNQDRSFGGWYRSASVSSVTGLFSLGTANTRQGHLIIILSATSIRVDLYADALGFTVPSMSNDTFYWVWTEYTASSNSSRLYLNNTESSSGSQAHGGASNLAFGAIRTGADTDNASLAPNNSYFDDFRIYSGVTSSTERAAIYAFGQRRMKDIIGGGKIPNPR